MNLSVPELKSFLVEAKQHGYGSENAVVKRHDAGDRELVYSNSHTQLMYRDSWIGGNPYVGYEHVSARVAEGNLPAFKPVWGMAYRGGANKLEDVFAVNYWLKQALPNPDPTMPIRGPLDGIYNEHGSYQLEVEGTLEEFPGRGENYQ